MILRAAGRFFLGASLLFRAAALLIRTPKLAALAALPLVLTILLYISLNRYVIDPGVDNAVVFIQNLITRVPLLGGWEWFVQSVVWLLKIILNVSFWLFAVLAFSFSSTILGLPLMDFLAAGTERYTRPALALVPETSLKQELDKLLQDLVKSLLAAFLSLFCLLLAFIPFVAIFSTLVIWLLMAFQFLTYPQTRRGIPVRSCFLTLWQNASICLGFGAACTAGFAIPFFAAFVAPLAVVGGTMLYALITHSPPRSVQSE